MSQYEIRDEYYEKWILGDTYDEEEEAARVYCSVCKYEVEIEDGNHSYDKDGNIICEYCGGVK